MENLHSTWRCDKYDPIKKKIPRLSRDDNKEKQDVHMYRVVEDKKLINNKNQ